MSYRIVIHSPEKIGGRKHVTIEIYFTYVGKIRTPFHKPEPARGTEKPAWLPMPRRFLRKFHIVPYGIPPEGVNNFVSMEFEFS